MSILRAENLRKRYKARTVVQGASLEVASGEVVGLLGPNGAGKTTCFYMMSVWCRQTPDASASMAGT